MKTIIIGRNGTQKIPINDTSVSRQHCQLTINDDGTYILENLSQLGTEVDGRPIIKASVTLNSRIKLGPHFSATLKELIGNTASSRPMGINAGGSGNFQTSHTRNVKEKEEVKTYDLSHLQRIWEEYDNAIIENQEQQRKINLVRGGGMIFTMGGGALVGMTAIPLIGWICSGIGVATMIYSFAGMKNSDSVHDKKRRDEQFSELWVCPGCKKSLPVNNYKKLIRDYDSCPRCHCKWVAK